MRISKGWHRLCVVLSVGWVGAVLLLVLYEYVRGNPFCGFHSRDIPDAACSQWFWQWTPKAELPLFIAETDLSSASSIFLPNFWWLLSVLGAVPILTWATAFAATWIREGFHTER